MPSRTKHNFMRTILFTLCLLALVAQPTGSLYAQPSPEKPEAPKIPAAPNSPADPKGPVGTPEAEASASTNVLVAKEEPPKCLRPNTQSALGESLREFRIVEEGIETPIYDVQFVGLQDIDNKKLWRVIAGGDKPASFDGEQVATIVARLLQTGLFSQVRPTLELATQDGAKVAHIKIRLTQYPFLRKIEFRGLEEVESDYLLSELLTLPTDESKAKSDIEIDIDEGDFSLDNIRTQLEAGDESQASKEASSVGHCPEAQPPLLWLSRVDGGKHEPGILRGGPKAALTRVIQSLYERGYLHASLRASLHSDGSLTVDIEEGRLQSVAIRGVEPEIADRVRELVSINAGDVFFLADLDAAFERVQGEFPFLRADSATRVAPSMPTLAMETGSGATQLFHSIATPCTKKKGDDDDDTDEDDSSCKSRHYALSDGNLVVHFKARQGDLDAEGLELFRHTSVTGYAPGLDFLLKKWDPKNRVHLHVGSSFHINTGREKRPAAGDDAGVLEQLAAVDRIDWALSASAEVPALSHAEFGGEVHSRTDTSDQWRMSRAESHFYSMVLNRPEAEFFRRTGASAFINLPLETGPLLSAEYRYDRYDSLESVDNPYSWFHRDEAGFANPAIDDGTIGSGLLRLEWGAGALAPNHRVQGQLRRHPEVSLLGGRERMGEPGFRTLNTVEVSRAALGSDDSLEFVRVISDNLLFLPVGEDQGLSLRVRAESGSDAPRQKEAALGGWGSMRGYPLKKFRGEAAGLVALEYRYEGLTGFVDFGAVKNDDNWTVPGPGVGASLGGYDGAELVFAWRTGEGAKAAPNVRLLFGRTF